MSEEKTEKIKNDVEETVRRKPASELKPWEEDEDPNGNDDAPATSTIPEVS